MRNPERFSDFSLAFTANQRRRVRFDGVMIGARSTAPFGFVTTITCE